ncbi:MAG: hypothetical protein KDA51_14415, partial [Planctomycetales bacterium]|nr:hypothetical protein [Planctomycetales bacterium]
MDKSPRVVEYQLNRLSNEQLLLVETAQDDPKYLPVFKAILTREGMSRAYREQALESMALINGSDAVTELTRVLGSLSGSDAAAKQSIAVLVDMLFSQPPTLLSERAAAMFELTGSGNASLHPIGYAAHLMAAAPEQVL